MTGTLVGAEDLDQDGRAALQRLILTLADSKRLMGIRYSDWILGSPSIETGIAGSSMAQDEWGHARLLYAMLKALDVDPVSVEHDRPGEEYASVGSLDEPMPDWAALVAAMVVVDGALTVVLDAFGSGRYEPATARIPKMTSEEEFHASLGAAWYRRLAESADDGRVLLKAATERLIPDTLAWVGADDEAARTLEAAGVLSPASQRLAAYRAAVGALAETVGVDLGAVEASEAWDASRGRTPGRPDEDAVERARGDRNRALFVE